MNKTLKRAAAAIMVFAMLFSQAACTVNRNDEEEEEPAVYVLNDVSCYDSNPPLLIEGVNLTFDAFIEAGDIQFAGAFRSLQVCSLDVINDSTLLLNTEGDVYSEDAVGHISIGEKVNSTNTELLLDVNIDRSDYGRPLVGGSFLTDLGLGLLKGIVTTGADKAFGYGLDKLLYDKLGIDIATLKTVQLAIRELSGKIDALSVQMNEMEVRLTDVINESTKTILTNEYLNTFENLHTLITSIKTDTVKLWNDIATIEATADETSEEYRTLVIAELLTFSELEGKSVSPLVSKVAEAITYIDGTYFSLNPECLYDRVFKVGCTRSVFGGEAAVLVSDYLNSLNKIISEAIDAMVIVCQAKYYTYRQMNVTADNPEYKDVITFVDGEAVVTKEQIVNLEQLAETDPDLKIRLTSGAVTKYKDKSNGAIWQNYLTQFANNVSRLFDETNSDSVLSRYNTYVRDHCNSYNRSYKVTGEYVDIDFVDLRTAVAYTGSAECGVWGSGAWRDSDYQSKATGVNDTVHYYIHQCMNAGELDTFFRRLMSNESGLLFGESEEEKSYTIGDVLKLYGFSVPSGDSVCYFATDNKVDLNRGKLTLVGYPALGQVTVNRNGEIASSTVESEEFTYYDYKGCTQDRCYFYYFEEQSLIYTVDDLVDFLEDVADGQATKCCKLMADLDVSGIDWAVVWPTAKAGSEFRGVFDGNNHTISNLTYDEGENKGCRFGMFRTVGKDAVIKNLTFTNVSVNCENSDSVGVCAGVVSASATISGVKVTGGTVRGGSNVGGLVGLSNYPNTMSSCSNAAAVTGKSYVSGLVGKSETGGTSTFSACKNEGEITATAGTAGGFVGYLEGSVTISKSTNTGKISGYKDAGGFAGTIGFCLTAKNSTNSGEVTASTANAGGLVGNINSQTASVCMNVNKCENRGNITGKNSAGGLVGRFNNSRCTLKSSTFENSYNYGSVTAENYAGGFIGYGYYVYVCQMKTCSNKGSVTATVRSAGGIIGETEKMLALIPTEVTSEGSVSGKKYTGENVGYDAYGYTGKNTY